MRFLFSFFRKTLSYIHILKDMLYVLRTVFEIEVPEVDYVDFMFIIRVKNN